MVCTIVLFWNSVIKITAGLYYSLFGFLRYLRLRGSYFVLLVCLWHFLRYLFRAPDGTQWMQESHASQQEYDN